MKNIAIIGAGGFGREVKWLIDEINATNAAWNFIGYFDDDFSNARNIDSNLFLGGIAELNNREDELAVVFAIGNPIVKRKVYLRLNNPLVTYPVLIHPTVRCSKSNVEIAEGTIICAGTLITVDIKIGKHVILNLGCTVGHDTVIGDFSSFMPSVNISGEVTIGEAVYVGTGVKIINRLEIGGEAIIGAGAVVAKSLPGQCTAVGIPAKPVKFHGQ